AVFGKQEGRKIAEVFATFSFFSAFRFLRLGPVPPRGPAGKGGGQSSESLACLQFRPVPGDGTRNQAMRTRHSTAGATLAIRRICGHRLLRRSSTSPRDVRRPRRSLPLPAPGLGAVSSRCRPPLVGVHFYYQGGEGQLGTPFPYIDVYARAR